jgi:hypothetical protein
MKTVRMDLVGQNGNDGKVYLAEDIAKIIYESHMVNARCDWTDFISVAMKIIERCEKDED